MATPQGKKKRLFTQIGDSSDGEDDYTVRDDFVQELNDYKKKADFNLKNHPNVDEKTFNISTSCMLKEIGHQVLQNETVRVKYRKIKENLVPIGKEYEELDEKLGRGWNTLVTKYYRHKNTKKKHDEAFEKYFKLNEEKINNECKDEVFIAWNDLIEGELLIEDKISERIPYINLKDYPNELKNYKKKSTVVKFFTELPDYDKGKHYLNKLGGKTFMGEVDDWNSKIHENFDELRRNITKPVNLNFNDTESGSFLARLLSSQKLDKDLTTNCYFRQRSLDLCSYDKYMIHIDWFTGKCTYEIEDLGTYKKISKSWSQCSERTNIKEILKSYFRGESLNEDRKVILFKWRYFIELIGVEIIRNSSALLTWPMFLDLLDNGIYGPPDLKTKLPSALKGAVDASCVISEKMNRPFYDCREVFIEKRENKDVADLANRDEQIVYDWLQNKATVVYDSSKKTFEVPANVFYNLIYEWYKIKMSELNNEEIIQFYLPSATVNQNVL